MVSAGDAKMYISIRQRHICLKLGIKVYQGIPKGKTYPSFAAFGIDGCIGKEHL